MEATVKERLIKFLKFYRFSQKEFCDSIGVCRSYVSTIRQSLAPEKLSKIREVYPELNIEWLLTGKGSMLNSSAGITMTNTGNIQGNGNNVNVVRYGVQQEEEDDVPMSDVEDLPVVPSRVYFDPDENIIDYLQNNNVRKSPRVKQFPRYDIWLPVCENTMAMECKPSDKLAVRIMEKENSRILNGRMYVLDLVSNPSILCYLTQAEGGYIASYENSRYSDDFIPFEEIVQIYKVVGLIRSFE